jgi:acyl carrier protein
MADTATTVSLQNEIRSFILENFLLGEDTGFGTEESLMASGIVDSTGVLELIEFLENRYEFTIDDHELVPANLDNIAAIGRYIRRKVPE